MYLIVRKASSPKDGGKEASTYIDLNRSIRVLLDRSAILFCSSVYGARHLKVMPLSAYYVSRVSSVCLNTCLLLLQKKTTS